MTEQRVLTPVELNKREAGIIHTIDNAYSFAGGIGIHAYALDDTVRSYIRGEENTRWLYELSKVGSHFTRLPHFYTWMEPTNVQSVPCWENDSPFARAPLSDFHTALIRRMHEEYILIRRTWFRIAMAGEEWAAAQDSRKPIADDEFRDLFIAAKKRGLIDFDGDKPPKSEVREDITFGFPFQRAGGRVIHKRLASAESDSLQSHILRRPIIEAAAYKLGGMLGYLDQLTFEAKYLGFPIRADYKPPVSFAECSEEEWRSILGGPIPGLAQLYQQSHAILVSSVERMDMRENEGIKYLLGYRELPWLA